eukprot:gnl/TRDRNA2_/TRDRNA2_199118_c0_seq1.p1 gnl/TRDRNA2_/TRDRNA2_199118_c0~~gnl/TRDRNA2_/TRDRNA2_199118_c0_seq1.p1  ORF type:complete len:238 (+),score=31.27 gnl/TRDRNA2_/TRDRNA2_199118_c0_seq1:72-785(+)
MPRSYSYAGLSRKTRSRVNSWDFPLSRSEKVQRLLHLFEAELADLHCENDELRNAQEKHLAECCKGSKCRQEKHLAKMWRTWTISTIAAFTVGGCYMATFQSEEEIWTSRLPIAPAPQEQQPATSPPESTALDDEDAADCFEDAFAPDAYESTSCDAAHIPPENGSLTPSYCLSCIVLSMASPNWSGLVHRGLPFMRLDMAAAPLQVPHHAGYVKRMLQATAYLVAGAVLAHVLHID